VIFLLQPSECWDYGHVSPCSTLLLVFFMFSVIPPHNSSSVVGS
jgi:hypothetical protein